MDQTHSGKFQKIFHTEQVFLNFLKLKKQVQFGEYQMIYRIYLNFLNFLK